MRVGAFLLPCGEFKLGHYQNLQPPVEFVDKEVLDDIYLGLSAESPDDWKAPEEWGNS